MPKRNICKNNRTKTASTSEPSAKRRKTTSPDVSSDFESSLLEHQLLQKIAMLEAEKHQLSKEADENAAKMSTILQQNRKYAKDNEDLKSQLAEYESNTEMLVDMLVTQGRVNSDSVEKKSTTSSKNSSRSKSPRKSSKVRRKSPVVVTDFRESKRSEGRKRRVK